MSIGVLRQHAPNEMYLTTHPILTMKDVMSLVVNEVQARGEDAMRTIDGRIGPHRSPNQLFLSRLGGRLATQHFHS